MKKFLSLVLALVMTMSLVTISAGAKDFTDDDKITYEEAVNVISEIGVVDGYADGKFNPTNTLTRQAAAKIICNLILGPTTAAELHADTAPYKDVPATSEFAGYIAYCAKEGIISGYADGTFKPGNTLTGYAFMKMLLGALGYDASIEGYTGGNWSINVAKQAIAIGLNKSLVGEFNGIKAVNREEACLYAFNTLQADMVEYDTTISTTINGQTVTIGNSLAKAQKWNNSATKIDHIKDDEYIQFAEQYFPKLEKKDDTDDFMRPAYTWVYNKDEIGTYVDKDKLVESYTSKVTGKDIYDLLKAAVIRDNSLECWIDGVENDAITKTQLVRSYDKGLTGTGDGVLTEVYLDTDDGVLTIVSINTYLAQATADYSESKEYAPLNVFYKDDKGQTWNVDVVDVPEVADVEDEAYYLVNISKKDSAKGDVVAIQPAEILEDSTVSKFSAGSDGDGSGKVTKLTTGGTQYKRAEKAYYKADVLDEYDKTLLTDATYTVYLDQYGYFIGVEEFEGTQRYVFVTGYDRSSSNLSIKKADAAAIFLDGTMDTITVNVTDTNDNIGDVTTAKTNNYQYFSKWVSGGDYHLNRWYTYTVDEAGVYTLKPATRMNAEKFTGTDVVIDTANVSVLDNVKNVATSKIDEARSYGEDASVYITVDLDDVDYSIDKADQAITEVTGVYTGVQSVDLEIDTTAEGLAQEAQVYSVFDSDGYIIGAIVIGEGKGSVANYAYILSKAKSEEKIGDTYYWEFEAIVNGEVQTLTAKSKYSNTITKLAKNTVQELRFDGDYVVSIKNLDTTKTTGDFYTDYTQSNADDYDVYWMTNKVDAVVTAATDLEKCTADELTLSGRTLYVTGTRKDVGLALAADAKAVTIQDENADTDVKTEFTSVSGALGHLADADEEAEGLQFSGKVIAILNSKGAAEWVVFINDNGLYTGSKKDDDVISDSSVKAVAMNDGTAAATDKGEITVTLKNAISGKKTVKVAIQMWNGATAEWKTITTVSVEIDGTTTATDNGSIAKPAVIGNCGIYKAVVGNVESDAVNFG